MIYVYQGTPAQSAMFFDKLDPGSTAIADPDRRLYRRFGIRRGGLREMFGWRAWVAGAKAALDGHTINRKIGDPWTLPTVLAVRNGSIVWSYRGAHAGDHPPVDDIPILASAAAGTGTP